jgi:hypothetical protein
VELTVQERKLALADFLFFSCRMPVLQELFLNGWTIGASIPTNGQKRLIKTIMNMMLAFEFHRGGHGILLPVLIVAALTILVAINLPSDCDRKDNKKP